MWNWLTDQVLAYLQRRCAHPESMVAADALEGCSSLIRIRYCRRCGAYAVDWNPTRIPYQRLGTWVTPNPNLWRGK